jgi:hypothetical protein
LELELADDERLDVPRTGIAGEVHRPGNERARLPVTRVASNGEGVADPQQPWWKASPTTRAVEAVVAEEAVGVVVEEAVGAAVEAAAGRRWRRRRGGGGGGGASVSPRNGTGSRQAVARWSFARHLKQRPVVAVRKSHCSAVGGRLECAPSWHLGGRSRRPARLRRPLEP